MIFVKFTMDIKSAINLAKCRRTGIGVSQIQQLCSVLPPPASEYQIVLQCGWLSGYNWRDLTLGLAVCTDRKIPCLKVDLFMIDCPA